MRAQFIVPVFAGVVLSAAPALAEDIPPPPDQVRPVVALAIDLIVNDKPPGLGADLRAAAGVRWRALSVAGEFRYELPEVIPVYNGRESITISQYSGAIVACGHIQWVGFCGVGQVTDLVMRSSENLTTAYGRVNSSAMPAFGLRVIGDVPLQLAEGRAAVRLSVELLGRPRSETIRIGDVQVWASPDVSVGLGLGFVGDFWTK